MFRLWWHAGVGGILMASLCQPAFAEDDYDFALKSIQPWVSSKCDAPEMNFPRWAGFPVTLCDYSGIGIKVRTYMLNADKKKIARWVVTACSDAKAVQVRDCIKYLAAELKTAASFSIFPVSGYIPEPQNGGRCYVFRDGVTVWTTLKPDWQSPTNKSCGTFEEADAPLHTAWKYARIASTTRQDYQAYGGALPVDGSNWVNTTRQLYQKAWTSERNELLSAKAASGRKAGKFK